MKPHSQLRDSPIENLHPMPLLGEQFEEVLQRPEKGTSRLTLRMGGPKRERTNKSQNEEPKLPEVLAGRAQNIM